jgi:leucyl/phenylalanyl-tRNA--protein transferase
MIVRLKNTDAVFPPCHTASTDPDGLLAIGGKLTSKRLVAAYKNGIFPWFNDDNNEILWWCPSERAVMTPGKMKVSKSLRKTLNSKKFKIKADQNFSKIIRLCATNTNRKLSSDTWITNNMIEAYSKLHAQGIAHSIEVYEDNELVGGLYGVAIGGFFCGESMFYQSPDASKVAFYYLQEYLRKHEYDLIDCQIMNPHLLSLGAFNISRDNFLKQLNISSMKSLNQNKWEI